MRLNFNNIGVGLEAIAGAKRASDLAQESARYNVTEGAYGPGLQENIQQLQSLRDQDPAQAAAYDQAIEELTRRQGLTAPDYSVASGPTNFATRQEARQASAPLRAEGLAGVYRRYGDVEKADALEARAYEQQRALAAEKRAEAREARDVAAEGRAAQDFSLGQSERGLRLNALARAEAEIQRETDFATFAAERPDATTQELKDAAFKQFKFTPKQWQAAVATRLQIETGEMDSFKNSVKKKLQGKNLTQLGELYNSDPDFDDKTDLAIVPGKGGAVTLNFIDKATGKVTSSQSFKNEALATEFLNKQAIEPETIGSWMMALRKTEGAIDAQAAQTRASEATVGLRGLQAQMLKTQAAANVEAQKIRAEYEALSPEEQVGAKGQGLIRQFNMANAKAGNAVPLGAAARPEFTPRDYAATVKSFTDAGFSPTDALIRADQLYGRGPADANVDAGLQKQNAQKAAKTPATTTRRGPGDLSTVDIEKIRADAAALDTAITQAQAQASAAVRSGDTTAIRLYGDRLNALRAQRAALTEGLTAAAVQTLGLK